MLKLNIKTIFKHSSAKKIGLAPGSVVHIGHRLETDVKIKLLEFSKDQLIEQECINPKDWLPFKNKQTVKWFRVSGLHDVELIEELGRRFDIHPLVLEDIVNTHQRPKIEEYDNLIYIVFRIINFDSETITFQNDQLSILIGSNYILTFEEKESDLFQPIVQRIKNSHGKFRTQGADFLSYSIIDLIVDHYFLIEDSLTEIVELLEDELLLSPQPEMLNKIQKLKRGMIFLRRSVSPLREVLAALLRSESSLISESTKIYIRDVYDHAIRVIEGLDSFRDLTAGLLEIYLSSISNKMNEVMKILTVFASIFIPLTFFAGVYGMNFEFMPELKWRWAYPLFWIITIVTSVSLLIYFRRKKWI